MFIYIAHSSIIPSYISSLLLGLRKNRSETLDSPFHASFYSQVNPVVSSHHIRRSLFITQQHITPSCTSSPLDLNEVKKAHQRGITTCTVRHTNLTREIHCSPHSSSESFTYSTTRRYSVCPRILSLWLLR